MTTIDASGFGNSMGRKFPYLLLGILTLCCGCKLGQSSQTDPATEKYSKLPRSIEVGTLDVRDISGPGARLRGFEQAFQKSLLLDEPEQIPIRLVPNVDAQMVVEILNVCAGGECQLVANATLSRPGDAGLRERYQSLSRVALDGIDYQPHLSDLSRALLQRLFAEVVSRNASSSQLSTWLKSGSPFEVDSAIRAVASRQLVDCAPEVAALLESSDEEIALLAVAAAGVLASPSLLVPLGDAALGGSPAIFDAAVQALIDIGSEEAKAVLQTIVGKSEGTDRAHRVQVLLQNVRDPREGEGDKLSPSP